MADLGAVGIPSFPQVEISYTLMPLGQDCWQTRSVVNPYLCSDVNDTGVKLAFYNRKTVAGKVTLNGAPVSRTVRVFHKSTSRLVGYAVSGTDGLYSILVTTPDECTVVVYDDNLNAVSMDHVFPV